MGRNPALQHSNTPVLQLDFKGIAMFEDLRGFLTHLENQKQLLRVKDEVSVKYEIAAGMRKTSDIEGPALLFENVKDYPGWRVLGRTVCDAENSSRSASACRKTRCSSAI